MILEGKKVVISSNTSWSIFNFRKSLIQMLQSKGAIVHCLAPRDDYASDLVDLGCEYTHLELDGKSMNPLLETITIIRMIRSFYEIKPDLILCFTIKPVIYFSLLNIIFSKPLIVVVPGLGNAFSSPGILGFFIKYLYRFSLRGCSVVFFLNNNDLDLFKRLNLVIDHKIRLLPSEGIDTDFFCQTRNSYTTNKKKRFLLMARLIYDKGIVEYIEAAKIILARGFDCQFDLLGFSEVQNPNAIPNDEISSWKDIPGINFIGSTRDVRCYVEGALAIILPSYYAEGVPRSLLEGASMSVPIITTDTPGCRDVVIDGVTGFLCEARDVRSLAARMEDLLKLAPDELDAMGSRGRDHIIANFSMELVIDEYGRAIDEL